MDFLWIIGQFVLTYIIIGNVLALFLLRLFRNHPIDKLGVVFVSLGLAPAIVSLILYFSFMLIPHAPSYLYVIIVLAAFAFMALVSWRSYTLLLEAYRSLFNKAASPLSTIIRIGIALVVTFAVIFVFYKAVSFPIQANDQLQHAYIGRTIFEDHSLEHFPLMTPTEAGFTLNVDYPPGLHMLYAWTYLLQGSTASDMGVRFVAPMYVIFTLLLLWRWGKSLGPSTGLFAMLIMVTIPLYMANATTNHIDAYRIFFFCASLYLTYQLINIRSLPMVVITGLALALGVFSHILGLLAVPVALAAYFIFSKGKLLAKTHTIIILVLIAGLGAIEFARRFIISGSLLGPKLQIPYDTSELLSSRGFETINDILVDGVFRLFTDPQIYGFVGLLFLLSLTLLLSKEYRRNRLFLFLIFTGVGYAILLFMAPSPSMTGWGNTRYILTIIPVLCLCGGLLLDWVSNLKGKRWKLESRLSKLPTLRYCAKIVVQVLPALILVIVAASPVFMDIASKGSKDIYVKTIGKVAPRLSVYHAKTNSLLGLSIVDLSDEEKLIFTGGYWTNSVIWINRNTPEDSMILFTEDAPFCYYGERSGIYYRDNRMKPFYEASSVEEAYDVLTGLGIDYIQFSTRTGKIALVHDSWLEEVLGNPELCTLLEEFDKTYPAYVYMIVDSSAAGSINY